MTQASWRSIMPLAALALAGMAPAQTVTVGAAATISDAPIYIAEKKGFFRAEGLEVKVVNFRSAADMVAPLGIDPDRCVNTQSLAHDLAFYPAQGLIRGAVNLADVLDPSFADAARQELGPYGR
jgi:hypothetical protein